ncbi:hypothetical protein V7I42_22230 [Raoultella ornithinolytica]|uniref:hypothetical protein n=1 Tax=Raoultella ornithinolytica TaxID=54291 RepID=UPI002FEF05E7
MSAMERWDDDAFIQAMSEAIGEADNESEPVNLEVERQNPAITWREFSGDYQ